MYCNPTDIKIRNKSRAEIRDEWPGIRDLEWLVTCDWWLEYYLQACHRLIYTRSKAAAFIPHSSFEQNLHPQSKDAPPHGLALFDIWCLIPSHQSPVASHYTGCKKYSKFLLHVYSLSCIIITIRCKAIYEEGSFRPIFSRNSHLLEMNRIV